MSALWWSTKAEITLHDALEAADLGIESSGIGLLSSPSAFRVATVKGAVVYTREGSVALEPVFEARCFDGASELRWLRTDYAGGTAVLLSENEALAARFHEAKQLDVDGTIEAQYLLWGTADGASANGGQTWIVLSNSRIGSLKVPVTVSQSNAGQRVRLCSVEYLAKGEHGNMAVVEERLIGLKEYTQEKSTI